MPLIYGLLFSLVTALLVIAGDTLIKVAADRSIIVSKPMAAGILLYGISAICWYFALRHVGLAQAAVAYSMLTLIALALIGWYAFGETMGPREIAGLACACLAMVLMVRIA